MVRARHRKERGTKGRAVVITRGLVKVFGDLRAVDGLDMEIMEGELYGLLGPNGSGKTTTIRMIMGLLNITDGEAEALGTRIPDSSIAARIGYMPQETAIYREITVRDNIVLFGEMYEVPPDRIGERMERVLRLVDLWGWRDEATENLSGGMMHRLSLACCLLHDPDLLFLDEPTVGVDPELRETLWGYFKDLCSQGKTVVVTTHYIEEARHCDTVGLMQRGRIIAVDTPRALMKRTSSETLEDAFLKITKERTGVRDGTEGKMEGGEEE